MPTGHGVTKKILTLVLDDGTELYQCWQCPDQVSGSFWSIWRHMKVHSTGKTSRTAQTETDELDLLNMLAAIKTRLEQAMTMEATIERQRQEIERLTAEVTKYRRALM